jgi:hypothetical protein
MFSRAQAGCLLLAHSVGRVPSDDRIALAADIASGTQLTLAAQKP